MAQFKLIEDSSGGEINTLEAENWETAASDILAGMGYRLIELPIKEKMSQFPLKLGGLDNFSGNLRYTLTGRNAFLQGSHEQRHFTIAADAAKAFLGLLQNRPGPPPGHVGISPTFHIAA